MRYSKAEDDGGLSPAEDDNAAVPHFCRRTLPIFKCFDYIFPLETRGTGDIETMSLIFQKDE